MHTLTNNDAVLVLAENLYIQHSFFDSEKVKNKEYNYMVCIPRKLDIFKHKE